LRFSTFAARTIEGGLKQHFRDRTWDVSVPRSTRQLVTSMKAVSEALAQKLRRSPTPAELAAELGVDLADVTLALEASMAYRAQDLDSSSARNEAQADQALARVDARIMTPQLLAVLPADERVVLELRFFEGLSQDAIADRVGVSQMQVSRLLRRSLATLRSELESADIEG
jgi:RNA polymerase sigma-B factor